MVIKLEDSFIEKQIRKSLEKKLYGCSILGKGESGRHIHIVLRGGFNKSLGYPRDDAYGTRKDLFLTSIISHQIAPLFPSHGFI